MTFWIDNIVAIYNTNIIVPHPSMKIEPAAQGLNLMASLPGGQYQREGIRSIPADSHQWYGNPDPVTYSVTFAKFPDGANYGGFQSHIFLVPDTAGGTAPDYSDPNAIMLDIKALASNGGSAVFRFKTNQPNGNGQMYTSGQGQLVTLNAPTILGTWSLTFSNNNNVTLVGPGGAGTNFNMPADAAALFQTLTPSMGTYFGIQPNNTANVGQRAVISHIKITDGSTVVVDDTFPVEDSTQETDPNLWINRVDGGLLALKVVDPTSVPSYWVSWNLPDPYVSNFQMSTSLLSGWADPGLTFRLNGSRRDVFVGPSVTAGAPASYFRLVSTNAP